MFCVHETHAFHAKTRTGPVAVTMLCGAHPKVDRPVVLLEGSRDVPLEIQGRMEQLAARVGHFLTWLQGAGMPTVRIRRGAGSQFG